MSIIYGKRVRLRGAERSDLEKFVVWINDPEVTAGLTGFTPITNAPSAPTKRSVSCMRGGCARLFTSKARTAIYCT